MSGDGPFTKIVGYKKILAFLLAIYFSFVLIGIALDQHFQGFSKNCLICRTKSMISGLEAFFIFDFFPKITWLVFVQFPLKLDKIYFLSLQNKSPPTISFKLANF